MRVRRWLPLPGVLVALALVLLLSLPTFAFAQPALWAGIEPDHGPPGASVRMTGYTVSNELLLCWDSFDNNSIIGNFPTSYGDFSFTFNIPANATPGQHLILGNLCCPHLVSLPFTVEGVAADAYADDDPGTLPPTGVAPEAAILLAIPAILAGALLSVRSGKKHRH